MEGNPVITSLVMDVENVLTSLGPWQPWLLGQLSTLGQPAEPLLRRWLRSDLQRCAHAGLISIWHAWFDFLRAAGADAGWAEELVIGLRCRVEKGMAECRLSPEAENLLRQLGTRHVQVALLAETYWTLNELDAVLHRLQLPFELSLRATTASLGSSGPHPRAFQILLDRWGLPAQQVAYLGCHVRALASARQAGLFTIRLGSDTLPAVDLEIRELPALIAHLPPATKTADALAATSSTRTPLRPAA